MVRCEERRTDHSSRAPNRLMRGLSNRRAGGISMRRQAMLKWAGFFYPNEGPSLAGRARHASCARTHERIGIPTPGVAKFGDQPHDQIGGFA